MVSFGLLKNNCFKSKLLEKIVYSRVLSHLNKYSLLIDSQYGFRANHSCDHALMDLHDFLTHNINKNLHSFGIFLDLSKAFDLIDHSILLTKLSYFGIRGIPLKWFQNYLSDRSQFISYKSCINSFTIVSFITEGNIVVVFKNLSFCIYFRYFSKS